MAFGSATLPVRTKTKVKIKSSVTTTKTSSSAVASTSKLPMAKGRSLVEQAKPKRRESLPDPSDSEEDDDPDFGRDAKEDARREAEELAEQEAVKGEKAERRRAKELAKQRGEVYAAPKKEKKKKSRAKKEEEPERAVRKPPKRSTEIRPAVGLSSDDEDDNATRSTYDPDARKKQASARLGYSVEPSNNSAKRQSKGKGKARARDSDDTSSADSSAGEGYLKKKAAGRRKQYPDTEEGRAQEIQDHLKRKWINKNDPERMTAYRKEMEEMHNPLVRLLDVKITIIDEDGDSMEEGHDGNRVHLESDSDDDKPVQRRLPPPPPKKPLPTPMLDKLQVKLEREDVELEAEDVKPAVKSDEDVKPKLPIVITLSDEEDEPDTAEEDDDDESPTARHSARSSPVDVKPQIPPPGLDVEMIDIDSESEPPTEDDCPEPSVAQAINAAVPGTEVDYSVETNDTEDEPDTEDDAMVIEEEEKDEFVKGIIARTIADEAKSRKEREERARKEDEEHVRKTLEAAEEARQRRAIDSDVDDQDGEVYLSMSQATERAASQSIPKEGIRPHKGRPKFPMFTEQQINRGPHKLSKEYEVPAPINKHLRDYQRDGVDFLFHQFTEGKGGILGDDMGLGKTIQVIAFLSAVMKKSGRRRDVGVRSQKIRDWPAGEDLPAPSEHGITCLIICPASVVHNWEREFHIWSYIDVCVYGGPSRQDALRTFRMGHKDVVICGLETARRNIATLIEQDFSMVIVDEVHRVKNPDKETTIAVRRFPTKLRYGLTGTAVQNRLVELWCILDWAVPGQVGNKKQWNDLLSRPLKFLQNQSATTEEIARGHLRAVALNASLLPEFWLRRTKESVKLQLPRKIDNVVLCPLTDTQKEVYNNIMQLPDVQLLITAYDPCPCGAVDTQGVRFAKGKCCNQGWSKLIFQYMDLFRKISNHLALIYPNKEDLAKNAKKYEQDLVWAQAAFPEDWHMRKVGGVAKDYDSELCGKWTILCDMLDVWKRAGDKVLLFTNSLKVIGLLQSLFETKPDYKFVTLDGSVATDDRMRLVDEFNSAEGNVDVFLISTKAGGVGLNLTAANRVVLFDPNWNPSHDLQAMDRSYRFGQTREVHVYRFVGAGTIEELIFNRQQAKRGLANIAYEGSAERRLYNGVEGEGREHQGELYGVRNIFKYSEHWSLTERTIKNLRLEEDDNLPEVDENGDPVIKEIDGEEVVQEFLGGGERKKVLSATETRKLAEQEQMKRILNGAYTVESSSTLGHSKAEAQLARDAIQEAQGRRKPARRSSNSAQAKGGNLSSVDEDEEDEDEDEPMPKVKPARKALTKAGGSFDPFARKRDAAGARSDNKSKVKKKVKVESKAKPQVKAVKVEPEPEEEDVKPKIKAEPQPQPEPLSARDELQRIKFECGIPPGVTSKEIFAANGVTNEQGRSAFFDELWMLSEEKQRDRLVRLLKGYVRATTGGGR